MQMTIMTLICIIFIFGANYISIITAPLMQKITPKNRIFQETSSAKLIKKGIKPSQIIIDLVFYLSVRRD